MKMIAENDDKLWQFWQDTQGFQSHFVDNRVRILSDNIQHKISHSLQKGINSFINVRRS